MYKLDASEAAFAALTSLVLQILNRHNQELQKNPNLKPKIITHKERQKLQELGIPDQFIKYSIVANNNI